MRITLTVLAVSAGCAAWGQIRPPNDNFTNRFLLTGMQVSARGTNIYATSEPGEPPHAGQPAQASLWWSWQAPYDGTALLSVTNSGYSVLTRSAVYTGAVLTNLSLVASNAAATNRVLAFPVTGGQAYQIAVDKRSGSSVFALNLWLDTLMLAQPLPEARIRAGTAVALVATNTETDHPLERVDFYVSTNWLGTAAAPPFTFTWTPLTTGRQSLGVVATNSLGERRDAPLVWVNVVPANDNFADAAAVPSSAVSCELNGENRYATAELGEPAHAGRAAAKSLWWRWTSDYGGRASLSTTSAGGDRALAVYTGDALTNLVLVAASTSFTTIAADFDAVAGTTYWIAVDGNFTGSNGAVQVQLELTTLRFANAPWTRILTGQTLDLIATNYESDHPFSTLALMLGTNIVAGSLAEPWVFSWATDQPGEYTFQWVGTNNVGQMRQSDTITVWVSPANDDFANAMEIPALTNDVASVDATTAYTTHEPGESTHLYSFERGSVWFTWVAPWTGQIYFSTAGSQSGSYIVVYQGDALTNLSALTSDTSSVAAVQQGERYYIAADSYWGSWGPIRISVFPPPPNNDFAKAIELPGASGTFQGTNISANAEPGEPMGTADNGASVWWRWTSPGLGDFVFTPNDLGGASVLYSAYVGNSLSNLVPVVAPTTLCGGGWCSAGFRARAGETYYFRLSGANPSALYGGMTCSYSLNVLTNIPVNDDFANRIALSGPTNYVVGDNTLASREPGEPGIHPLASPGRTLWWSYTASEKGLLRVHAEADSYGVAWNIYRGQTVADLTEAPALLDSEWRSVDMNPGEEVEIAADGMLGGFGPLRLETTFVPVPDNDMFSNSVHLEGTNVTASGDAIAASSEPGEPPSEGRTVWYSWAAPTAGKAVVHIIGPTRYTMGVYLGPTVDHLQLVRTGYGALDFLAIGGKVYHIQVAAPAVGYAAGLGEFELGIDLTPCATAPNDDFNNAYSMDGSLINNGSPPLHEWITLATTEPGEPAYFDGQPCKSLWWHWEAPINGKLDLALDPYTTMVTNALLAVFTGSSVDALQLVAKGTKHVVADVLCRTVYHIAVVTDPTAAGDVSFNAGLGPNATAVIVPGNLLLDPSFEGYGGGWQITGDLLCNNGAMDGLLYGTLVPPAVMYQEFATQPGKRYRCRFAYSGGMFGAGGRINVEWDNCVLGLVQVIAGQANVWNWAQFDVTASNSVSRLTFQSLGVYNFSLDAASVVPLDQPPAITTDPVSQSTVGGGSAAFSVAASGAPPLAYQWLFNGSPLADATRTMLTLNHVSTDQAGSYSVAVTNLFGAVTSASASLTVEAPAIPTLVLQPYSDTVAIGGYFALSAAAAGTPPLFYQWFRNEVPVPDATNAHLVFASFQSTNAGAYTVKVWNAGGTVWSLPATLTASIPTQGGGVVVMANSYNDNAGYFEFPIYDVDGLTMLNGADADYVAQLYAGSSIALLRPVGTPRPFYTGFDAGFFVPETEYLPTVPYGGAVLLQVRVWDRQYGMSYEEARALGSRFGRSQVLASAAGGNPPGGPPVPYPFSSLRGMTSFTLHAGMPRFEVGRIEPGGQQEDGTLIWSLVGEAGYRYLIERCTTNFVWQPFLVLTNVAGTATFTDPSRQDRALYRGRILD
jgi:hypothetical protein